MKSIDLTSQRFGRLKVVRVDGKDRWRQIQWLCQCDCGKMITVTGGSLRKGNTQSCGCLHRERTRQANSTHQLSRTPLYTVWSNMLQRCSNAKHRDFHSYGGRGINVCPAWLQFEAFRDWALANGYCEGLEIDRQNNNQGYSPDNCRWINHIANSNNRRDNVLVEAFGETKTLANWARDKRCRVKYDTLKNRVQNYHIAPEVAITTAIGQLP